MTPIEKIMLAAAILLLIAILASKASSRLGVPALLFFLLIGMLAGSDGPGGIWFDDAHIAQSLGVVALALILFAGGLETEWSAVSPVLWKAVSLSTIGVLITAALVGLFTTAVLGFSWREGLLLGSVVSSTDAAAVFAVLRSRGVRLKGKLGELLELESGSNDPMAVFLTLGCIQLLQHPDASITDLIPIFLLQMTLGAAVGFGMGKAAVWLLNRLKLETEGLYPVLTLALVLLSYGGTALLNGSGFLAVYLAGIVMGSSDFVHKRSLIRFHDGLAWLMQITMFLVLGLLVFPSRLPAVAGIGLLMAFFLMLVARPAAVFISLAAARLGNRHKLLISWVGLRGAVPIILGTFPMMAGIPNAELYFNIVFFIVISSVLLQGTTLSMVTRWLRLEAPAGRKHQTPIELIPGSKIRSDLVEITIAGSSLAAGRQLVDLRLPRSTLVVLINRSEDFLVPRGSTVLQGGDVLLVLADKRDLAEVRTMLDGAVRAADERDEE